MNVLWRILTAPLTVACLSFVSRAEGAPAKGSSKRAIYKTAGPRKLRLDIDLPVGWKPTDRRPAIVFWSGGAFRSGGTSQFRLQARYFAERGMVAFRAEYRDRTKDNADLRTCIEDAVSAMRWIRKHAPEYGADPNRIVTSGGSAGGFLAAVLCSVPPDVRGAQDDASVSPQPDAMVLFNPALAPPKQGPGARARNKALMEDLKRYSPLCHLPKRFPPMLILIGSRDPFLHLCREFCQKARERGARAEIEVYEGQPHAFFNRGEWKRKTVERADAFLKTIGYLQSTPKASLPIGRPQRKDRTQRR